MKILIIGAGIGGLVSIRRAKQYNVDCIAYELSDNIGGMWIYKEQPERKDKENNSFPAPLYDSLRTHVPKQVMELPDFEFQTENDNCFPKHNEVLQYFHKFANHYDLLSYVKFNHKVIKISRNHSKWIVTTHKLLKNEFVTEEFDGIMICTGRNSSPTYPHITGIETFQGQQIHSCDYRNNKLYSGKTVLLIGARHSACDLSREIAQVAKKVFISHRRKTPLIISNSNIFQKPDVSRVQDSAVHFKDGTSEIIDSIIFCTGYDCILPYLDPSCEVQTTAGNNVFHTLYKKFINPYHPTMSILGTYRHVAIFKLFDIHAEIFIKIMTNRVTLPSKAEMLSEIKRNQDKRLSDNFIGDKSDNFGFASKQNFIDICSFGNCRPVLPVIIDIFQQNRETVIKDFNNYKKYRFEIIADDTFKYWYSDESCN